MRFTQEKHHALTVHSNQRNTVKNKKILAGHG